MFFTCSKLPSGFLSTELQKTFQNVCLEIIIELGLYQIQVFKKKERNFSTLKSKTFTDQILFTKRNVLVVFTLIICTFM